MSWTPKRWQGCGSETSIGAAASRRELPLQERVAPAWHRGNGASVGRNYRRWKTTHWLDTVVVVVVVAVLILTHKLGYTVPRICYVLLISGVRLEHDEIAKGDVLKLGMTELKTFSSRDIFNVPLEKAFKFWCFKISSRIMFRCIFKKI